MTEVLPRDYGKSYGVVGILFGFLVVWHLASTIFAWYRLRNVPGPLVAAFTYLWVGRLAYSGRQHEGYRELDNKYGKLVRIGPNELMTSDPEQIRKMSGTKSKFAKSRWADGSRLNPYHRTMFEILEPRAHDRIKARLMPAYSGRDTPEVEAAVDEQVTSLIGLIRRKYLSYPEEGIFRTLNLIDVAGYFTLDVISKIALGQSFGCLETDSDPNQFYSGFGEYMPQLGLYTDVPWIRNIVFSTTFLRFFGPQETDSAGMGRLMKVAGQVVRSRYGSSSQEDSKDMLGSFMKHGLSQGDCEAETLFMFVAGSDTTASAIRMTLFHVVSCPRVYQRLKEEIGTAIKEGAVSNPITVAEAKGLPYLQAVIYEGLRIRPATTGQHGKEVPPEGETIDGKFIPGGTSIGINYFAISRSQELFGEDADDFRPERFLGLDEEALREMHRNVDLMFGNGRWMCAGRPIAFTELNKVYFELLRAFDFQLLDPQKPLRSESYVVFRDWGLRFRVTESDRMD